MQPTLHIKLPAQLSSEAMQGKAVFDAKCQKCHGVNAAGSDKPHRWRLPITEDASLGVPWCWLAGGLVIRLRAYLQMMVEGPGRPDVLVGNTAGDLPRVAAVAVVKCNRAAASAFASGVEKCSALNVR